MNKHNLPHRVTTAVARFLERRGISVGTPSLKHVGCGVLKYHHVNRPVGKGHARSIILAFAREIGIDGSGKVPTQYWLTDEYMAYICSPEWKAFKRRIIAERGAFCEECGKAPATLDLHHLTYVRLFHELPEDVKLLCRTCHEVADALRKGLV